MTRPSPQRSTRDRPAKSPLSKEAVVDAALAILKEEGLEAVTMRRVARALDTGAASLYVYVDNREALIQAMQDRVLATVELETPEPTRWRSQLHALLVRMHKAMAAHPGIAATTMVDIELTEPTMLLLENMMTLLLAGGLDPQDAGWVADICMMLVTYAAIEGEVRQPGHEFTADDIYKQFAALPADRFPVVTAHASQLVTGSSDERLSFAFDIVIEGALARSRDRSRD